MADRGDISRLDMSRMGKGTQRAATVLMSMSREQRLKTIPALIKIKERKQAARKARARSQAGTPTPKPDDPNEGDEGATGAAGATKSGSNTKNTSSRNGDGTPGALSGPTGPAPTVDTNQMSFEAYFRLPTPDTSDAAAPASSLVPLAPASASNDLDGPGQEWRIEDEDLGYADLPVPETTALQADNATAPTFEANRATNQDSNRRAKDAPINTTSKAAPATASDADDDRPMLPSPISNFDTSEIIISDSDDDTRMEEACTGPSPRLPPRTSSVAAVHKRPQGEKKGKKV
ncbi:hypothetical protein JCM3774_005676, partial [Rhodotorula dairenensis]